MNLNNMKLSFVIPCYNSQQTITTVCHDIMATTQTNNYEIILVNDYSKDNTIEVIRELCKLDNRITGLNLAANTGQHNAIMAGLNMISGDIVILLDDDGQTDPKQMYKLLDALDDDIDVVYAGYQEAKQSSLVRKIGTKLNDYMACHLLKKPKDIYLSSYIALKRYVVNEVIKYDFPYSYLDGLILRTTSNLICVPIEHKERLVGDSGYSFKKLLSLWISGFTSFSIIPLRVSMIFGLIFAIYGFGMGAYAIIIKLIDPINTSVGWSSIMATLSVIGGVILLVLGMIGEYIGRIFISLNNAPQFVVKEIINNKE